MAYKKFFSSRLKQKFWYNFESSLLHRFSPDTVFAYGSANIQPSKFRGAASSPNLQVKRILAKNFIVINTPEPYTSQRCCLCGQQVEQQKHYTLVHHKQETIKRASYSSDKEHFTCHGTVVCRNQKHGTKTFSRDVNSAVNMANILIESKKKGCYARPEYLTKQK